MATYSLSGTGIQALSASVTAVHATVTAAPSNSGLGRSNPPTVYDVGLLRFGDASGFFSPIAITGGPQWIAVPNGTTRVGYAVFPGGTVSLQEVIGGTPPFGSGASALAALSDVAIVSPLGTQVLTYNSATGVWENKPVPASSGITPIVLLNASPTTTTANNVSLPANTWQNIWTAQSFTPLDASRPLLLSVSGDIFVGGGNSAGIASRVSIDSGATIVMIGGDWHFSTHYANALAGAGVKALAPMSATAHSIQLQVFSEVADFVNEIVTRIPLFMTITVIQS